MYDYVNDEEGELLAEGDIFKRGEIEDLNSLQNIAREAGVNVQNRKKNEKFDDKLWRFYVYTNAISFRMMQEEYLTRDDRNRILRHIKNIENVAYKNPEAFVLGYYAINADKRIIDMNRLKRLLSNKDITMSPCDILRYARLWLMSFK